MPEMCKIAYNDYDRITDKVMWLTNGVTLNFTVDLFYLRASQNSENKIKENFHKEYLYKVDGVQRVKIVRDFNYYYTIEASTKDDKQRVRIFSNNIYFVIFSLEQAMKWFVGEDGINFVFSKDSDGKIFIPNHINPIIIDLAFGETMELRPSVLENKDEGIIGVNVYLNGSNNAFFIDSNTLFSLMHMLKTCNMYMMAQNMLSYIGRPEFGTNSFNFSTTNNTNRKPFLSP